MTYHMLHPLGGRFTLAQYLAAFLDGEELRPDGPPSWWERNAGAVLFIGAMVFLAALDILGI